AQQWMWSAKDEKPIWYLLYRRRPQSSIALLQNIKLQPNFNPIQRRRLAWRSYGLRVHGPRGPLASRLQVTYSSGLRGDVAYTCGMPSNLKPSFGAGAGGKRTIIS